MTLVLHILAGGLGLALGYVALYAAKGGTLHRKAGMLFVYVMLTMSATGLAVTLIRSAAPAVNVPAALLTAYLVVTALTALRAPGRSRWLDVGAMLVALGVGIFDLRFGFEALTSGRRNGIPAFPFLLFGVVGLMAGLSDIRFIRAGGFTGARRIARHLWRMCFALLIAAMAFFLGQADVLPKALRIPALLALPLLAVLGTMLYWLWRVRIRQTLRGIVGPSAVPEGARNV